ncbi:MAG: RNA-binding S4 domain-containing protein, partial [Muribaculaceae bacterium]|nr:RNA-binding S4 domain-containing protein [Muribaculaceae bacterium]
MDNNEKKGKRPRIGENRPFSAGINDATNAVENKDDFSANDHQESQSGYHQGGYQPRQGGYQPRRQQGGYNRYNNGQHGGYNRYNNEGGYQPRQRYNNNTQQIGENGEPSTDSTTPSTGYQPRQGGYQPRQGGYNRQGGYQPRQGGYQPRQGGYQPRQGQQGGYQPRQGGYNRQGQQGGYQPRQGGYNRQGQQGGYQPRQGGYNRQGQQGGYNRQGGFNRQGQRPNPRQNRFGMPQGGKSFTPRPKRVEYDPIFTDPDEQIRLNKYMANTGVCSRREADEFIQQGLVKVNGEVVTELGTKIRNSDVVEYDGKVLAMQSKCYILLNKPKDVVTTSDDPNGRMTVMDLVKGACDERIYPVGRLDRNTTGVLLLTNDGDLASKLTHPKFVKKKIYHVWTDKDISEDDMQRIADGIELEDGPIHADAISYATETDRNQAGIE